MDTKANEFDIVVEGAKKANSLAWHMKKCGGIMALWDLFLGTDVRPTAMGVTKDGQPYVIFLHKDYRTNIRVWEKMVELRSGTKPVYFADFNLSIFADLSTVPALTMDTYTICV